MVNQMFDQYDKDGSGYISKEECKLYNKDVLEELGTDVSEVSDDAFDDMFNKYDTNGNGKISKAEYA